MSDSFLNHFPGMERRFSEVRRFNWVSASCSEPGDYTFVSGHGRRRDHSPETPIGSHRSRNRRGKHPSFQPGEFQLRDRLYRSQLGVEVEDCLLEYTRIKSHSFEKTSPSRLFDVIRTRTSGLILLEERKFTIITCGQIDL